MALHDSAWYVSSVAYAAVTVRPQNTAVAAGVVRRQFTAPAVNNERAFVAIIAGTTANVTDATWVLTRGAKTVDGTATWQECTGHPAVNGDVSSPTASLTVRSANITLGDIIKNNAGTHYFICSTAGSASGASEPSYNTTTGATTTDGNVTWTCIGAVGSFPAWGAPHARLAAAFAATWGAAGNRFFVKSDHAETGSAAVTLTSPATAALPCPVVCVNSTSLPPVEADYTTGASISTTGSGAHVTFGSGGVSGPYYQGILFSAGSSSTVANINMTTVNNYHIFKNCAFKLNNTSTSSVINLGGTTSSAGVFWDNCTVQFASVSQKILVNSCSFEWRNTASALQGATIPAALFNTSDGIAANVVCRGVDLSAFSGQLLASNVANGVPFVFEDCKFHASMTQYGASSTIGYSMSPVITVRCDSGAANYKATRDEYAGSQSVDTVITRVGGGTDGIVPVSHKIVTNAQATLLTPYRMLQLSIDNDRVGEDVTVTLYGRVFSVAPPQNDEIWMECQYLSSSSSPLASFKSTGKSHPLAAGAAVASDGSAWFAPAAFTPAALTGLIGWWDASVTASLSLTGSQINSVADQSGGGNNMNWVNAKPVYSATGYNSNRPAIMLDNGKALSAAAFPMGTGNTLTAWCVATMCNGTGSTTDARLINYIASGAPNDWSNAGSWTVYRNGLSNMFIYRNGIGGNSGGLAVYPAPHRLILTVNSSGAMTLYANGGLTASGTAPGNWVSAGVCQIGQLASGSAVWSGPIGEAGVATSFADAAKVAELDAYLANKWTVAVAPSWWTFKLVAVLTAPQLQLPGYIYARVFAAKPSTTYYIDPKAVLS